MQPEPLFRMIANPALDDLIDTSQGRLDIGLLIARRLDLDHGVVVPAEVGLGRIRLEPFLAGFGIVKS